jgi:hypothetical protein
VSERCTWFNLTSVKYCSRISNYSLDFGPRYRTGLSTAGTTVVATVFLLHSSTIQLNISGLKPFTLLAP